MGCAMAATHPWVASTNMSALIVGDVGVSSRCSYGYFFMHYASRQCGGWNLPRPRSKVGHWVMLDSLHACAQTLMRVPD